MTTSPYPHLWQSDIAAVEEFLFHPVNPFAPPKQTLAFEAALAQYFDVREAVVVSSGTAALHGALAALGIGPGDEVLVPALSVVMSSVPLLYQQARPAFVDSAPDRVDFDYEDLERKLTDKTKAILPVYLWGCAYDMPRLMQFAEQHHLAVIEDACQAHGSAWAGKYLGTWGDLGCFSMRDGKLMATGEGGFVLTNHQELAERCRALRSHFVNGRDPARSYQYLGYNYRLSEVQALIGHKQLKHLDAILAHRHSQAVYLRNGLAAVQGVEPYPFAHDERPNWFSPLFVLDENLARKEVAKRLAQQGVHNSVGTFGLRPAQEWPVFQSARRSSQATPHARSFLSRALAITLLSHYGPEDLDAIITTIHAVMEELRDGRSHVHV